MLLWISTDVDPVGFNGILPLDAVCSLSKHWKLCKGFLMFVHSWELGHTASLRKPLPLVFPSETAHTCLDKSMWWTKQVLNLKHGEQLRNNWKETWFKISKRCCTKVIYKNVLEYLNYDPSNPYLVIDYCSFANDSCEHQCVSVLKGFHCVCNDGYTLNDDKKTCTS